MDNLFMIVAMTKKTRSIGKNNDMIYHIPEDLKYYKGVTMGNTIVIGYNTYMSFPKRPLPNRKNIVLSRSRENIDGVVIMRTVEEVLEYAKNNPQEKIFISGGDSVYKQFINHVSKLYITIISEEKPIDDAQAFFPEISEEWELESTMPCREKPEDVPPYVFNVYRKKG